MPKTTKKINKDLDQAETKENKVSGLDDLQAQLEKAQAGEMRAKADYHNLVRRNQEERLQFVKMATKDVVSGLLQPLEHLGMAATQINDTGLNMVIDQFWQQLAQQGLTEVEAMGLPFDITSMEVVEGIPQENGQAESESEKVIEVQRKGYKLNGEVIQYARVVLG
jgi:molecular chaperone GrpE